MDGPMLLGIKQFAETVGIGESSARDVCASENRPPGVFVGNRYMVIADQLPEWLRELARHDPPVRL